MAREAGGGGHDNDKNNWRSRRRRLQKYRQTRAATTMTKITGEAGGQYSGVMVSNARTCTTITLDRPTVLIVFLFESEEDEDENNHRLSF